MRKVTLREIPVEDIPTNKIPAIKFIEELNTGFTCSDETERVPTIYVEQTEAVPVYIEKRG